MRRILIENARSKAREKRGGDWQRVDFEELSVTASVTPTQLVALDEAMERLTTLDTIAGELVKLRYFAGLGLDQAALALGVSTAFWIDQCHVEDLDLPPESVAWRA
jgi:hypothetical protein